MGNVIQIDDGSKVYDITNMRGELLGQFKFIPSDFDLIRRYDETVSALSRCPRRSRKKMHRFPYVMELDKRIGGRWIICLMRRWRKLLSITPVHDAGQRAVLVENVLNVVKGIIEQERNVKLEAVQAHVQKYTQKYKTGPGGYIAPVK
ncbi:MAG: hypothetical protein ACLR8P_13960 [Clostridium fessum]